jgi:transposase
MPQNFIESRREQGFLLPPDVRDWLSADHLAWFVIDAVAEMDLAGFYAAYRADGHGRAAYEPSVMVALVLYAFATNVRSSRGIECHCRQDVAYRVITGNLVPDHATIARFIDRHKQALAALFTEVLKLCDEAGLVESGVVSIDGTRIAGNASPEVNYTFEQIAMEIVERTVATDEADDEELGEARGDELPEELRSPEGRREFFRRVRRQLRREEEFSEPAGGPDTESGEEVPLELDAEEIVGRGRQGRDAWLREGKRQLEQHRWDEPDAVSRSREERLLVAGGRLDQDLSVERRANDAYGAYREQGRMRDGRRFGRPPNPHQPPEVPQGKVNVTDPDSRPIPVGFGFVQGYNAQTAVNERHIVLRRRSPISRPTSRSWLRSSTLSSGSWNGRGSRGGLRRSRPMPATGTSSRWTRWWPTGTSRCWSRPTRAAVTLRRGGSIAGGRPGCEQCSDPSTAASDTGSENRRLSRSTVTPNTTGASSAFTDEAG